MLRGQNILNLKQVFPQQDKSSSMALQLLNNFSGMRNQIQHSQIQQSIRIAGRYLLALALCMSMMMNVGAVHNQQISPSKKTKISARLTAGEILEARERLSQLGYWVYLDAVGKDVSLHHALIAFQKVEGRKRTGVLDRAELDALRVAQMPKTLETGYPHIEIDLDTQVLFIVDCPESPLRILPISSGSGEYFTEGGVTRQALTPTGRFKIYRKVEGWRKSPLGSLYYPNYIYYGIAIHGNSSVPPSPASHGCIRIPMFASREFSEIASLGMEVIIYDEELLAHPGALSELNLTNDGAEQ